MEIIILAEPKEFWTKLENAIDNMQLIAFAKHQNTGEVKLLPNSEIEKPLEWLWSIWLSKKSIPANALNLTPAEEGWIYVEPPQVDIINKKISACWISAKAEWLSGNNFTINNDLKETFNQLRRRMNKNTKICEAPILNDKLKRPMTKRIRYTERALELQNKGWILTGTDIRGSQLKIGA